MVLLNQAFLSKSRLWIERRWGPIARLIGTITDTLSRRYIDTNASIASDVTATIARHDSDDFDLILLLRRLVDFAQIFNFSGVIILIDKVDETEATSNSANQTAALIHPLLSRVQLMEVEGFAWIFFLWDRVKGFSKTTNIMCA